MRRGLADQIKTVADLKGRAVGLSAPGSTLMYELAATLASADLTLKDVEIKHLHFGTNRPLRDSIAVPQLVFLPSAAIAGSAAIFSPCWTMNAS